MIYAITYTHTHMKTLGICVQLSLPKILKDVLHYVYIIYIYYIYIKCTHKYTMFFYYTYITCNIHTHYIICIYVFGKWKTFLKKLKQS